MRHNSLKRAWILIPFLILIFFGCDNQKSSDTNTSVPKGDPLFTQLTDSWVIDNVGFLSEETISYGNAVLKKLKEDGIAEVILLVQNGVKHPETYATHYGRWLKLGKKGLSTEGGNNGLVWLIRPDADEKITISVGRGLPKFTSTDYGRIMEESKDYFNFQNYDQGVTEIIEGTDLMLRSIYEKK